MTCFLCYRIVLSGRVGLCPDCHLATHLKREEPGTYLRRGQEMHARLADAFNQFDFGAAEQRVMAALGAPDRPAIPDYMNLLKPQESALPQIKRKRIRLPKTPRTIWERLSDDE